ncbi:MAG: sulfite exporter TauE/SafE family protein [Moritella sp.]|uniref:sulfite exporter TauE/SafE family protein n=1 Tax=Moritella sp. TaxID=78556 RepID=UPI0025DBA170|nr:sulfite exporter TauE/SafE family protein [Moritella sp.]NQZ92800.1 sulfite exporter TauE/SafE family protein [Moritella sp.]
MTLVLFFITFCAATLQAATGFGFGIIAVTAFLIILKSTSAVQIVIIITLAMSMVHWFKIRSIVPVDLVKKLIMGCLIGYPIGVVLFNMADIETLKIAVAILILLMSAQNGFERYRSRNSDTQRFLPTNKKYCAGVGTLSGAMASALAMPGPAVIGYLTQCDLDKNTIRAAVITTSTVSYAVALILQMSVFGIAAETWESSLMLLPATFAGLFFGEYISKFINPALFKNITLFVLLASGLNILITL